MKVAGTSLDKGVELDALKAMPAEERAPMPEPKGRAYPLKKCAPMCAPTRKADWAECLNHAGFRT